MLLSTAKLGSVNASSLVKERIVPQSISIEFLEPAPDSYAIRPTPVFQNAVALRPPHMKINSLPLKR